MFRIGSTQFATIVTLAGLVAGSGGTAVAQESNSFVDVGRLEYEMNCAACHGAEGKGDGRVAEWLISQPSDLTQIAADNECAFPREEVMAVIDGRNMIVAHGGDWQMPVWGARFMTRAMEQTAEVPRDVDPRAVVLGRITALVQYLESIQTQ